MAGNLTLALRTAQSGLLAGQAALDVVANNIANVNTPGYSRKIVNFEQRVVVDTGSGVSLSEITRIVDEGLIKSLRQELSSFNEVDVARNYYERLQELFGKPGDNTSLSHIVASFSEAIEALALSPERSMEQKELVRRGNDLALELQGLTTSIQDLRLQADQAIETVIDRANVLMSTIEDMNNKIIRNEAVSHDVTDLKDKRDEALTELSTLIDISYFQRNSGDVVVFTSGGFVLVDSAARTLSHNSAAALSAVTTYEEGHIQGIFVGATVDANDMTASINGGKLKGLIDLRDQILTGLQAQIDEFGAELRDAFNQLHNRGAPQPGLTSATGTRTFVAPGGTGVPAAGDQTITLSGGDVTIALFNDSGDQTAVTTLNTIMQDLTLGTIAALPNGPWTIDEVAATIEDWIQANGGSASASVSVNSDGKFAIDLNTSNLNIAFRDETASANGSTASDVTIRFNADGDAGGVIDQTVSGFSNFFGLNDFFIDGREPTRYDSAIQSSSYSFSPTGAVVLTFKDGTTTDSITIAAGSNMSLQDIADAINDTSTGISFVTAAVITEGSGYRLRLTHDDSLPMVVVDDQGVGATDSLLASLNLEVSSARTAQNFQVRSDINNSPGEMTRGMMQWDASLGTAGAYYMSSGDSSITQALAELMTNNNAFDSAGGLSGRTVSFTDYTAAIVAFNSSNAGINESQWKSGKALSESLELKSDGQKGVNLDEEMSTLILYQQAFAASARVISTINSMFDALERAVT
ncbi:MAG: flagellar hook-associated protein FlgK [Rhodospirillales bacterium]|nr:flagellar hook-associated protein FlgK [Rhodospirillales bacterium]